MSDSTREAVISEFGGQQFSAFKPALTDLAVSVMSPINDEMRRLMENPDHIDDVLRDGGERAAAIAGQTMNDVKDIVGLLR